MKTSLGPAALSAVLSLAVVGLAGCGADEPAAVPDPAPTRTSTSSSDEPDEAAPEQAITVEGPADLVRIFTEKEVAQLPAGTPTVADDGTELSAQLLERDGKDLLQVHDGTEVMTATIPEDSDTPYLLDVQLELGQAGAGWIVGHEGGDSTRLQVYVVRDGELVAARTSEGDPDLGGGFTADGGSRTTWFSEAGGPWTRVATGKPDQYRLYRWAVSGPGEGGGTDDLAPLLRAEDLGTACMAESATSIVVRRC